MSLATAKALLTRAEHWFTCANDYEDGVNWLNGQSEKYPGDAWAHAHMLLRDLRKALAIKRKPLIYERRPRKTKRRNQ